MKTLLSLMLFAIGFNASAHSPVMVSLGEVEATVAFLKPPKVGDYATMRLTFEDASSRQLVTPDAAVYVKMTMPDHGHDGVPVERASITNGVAVFDDMYFMMGGLWEIQVSLEYKDGRVVGPASFHYQLDQSGHHHH
ncbi:MAG: FixH family protein [Bdellovibrionales bacterium]|nr:FixH family protein [Bdellovibrionales bacterium]